MIHSHLFLSDPITAWADFAHENPNADIVVPYPAIDGDAVAIECGGQLPRMSVAQETDLWEKVAN